MNGSIRCARCQKPMSKATCGCGGERVYIDLYWPFLCRNGKKKSRWQYRSDELGHELYYHGAARMLNEMRRQIDLSKTGGEPFDPEDYEYKACQEMHFEAVLQKWLEKFKGAPSTKSNYQSMVKHFEYFDKMDVRYIKKKHIREFFDDMLSLKKKSSRQLMRNILHSLFGWMLEQEIIKEIPQFPKIEGEESKPRVSLEFPEQQEALSLIPEQWRDVFQFGMETGLRPGEICAIQIRDIQPRARAILIRRTWSGYTLHETVKQKEPRTIYPSDTAWEIVQRNIRDRVGQEFLFTVKDSHVMPHQLRYIWKRRSKCAVTPYEATRHSLISWLFETGLPDAVVQELAGHAKLSTTQRYKHLRLAKYRDVLNQRGQVIEIGKRNNAQ